jgi:hypothetical protein
MIFIIAMTNKIKIHLVFAGLLSFIYIVSSLIYNRSLSDLFLVSLYYIGIASIVFSFNIFRNRKIRWSLLLLLFIIPITYLIFTGINAPYTSSLEVLVTALPINLPFFPKFYSVFKDKVILPVVIYILCFVLPLIYFYAVYALSKMIFNQRASIKK